MALFNQFSIIMLGASNRIRPCAKDVGSTAVTRSLRLVSSNIFGPGLMTLSENRMPQRFDGFLSFSIFAHQACYSGGYPTCPIMPTCRIFLRSFECALQ